MLKSIFWFLFLITRSAAIQKQELPLKIAGATQRYWVSGAPKPRAGTTYTVKLYINTDDKVEMTNLWIDKQNVPFDVEYFTLTPPAKLNSGDSILLVYNRINPEQANAGAGKRLPVTFHGAALIEYLYKKRAKYLVVDSFIKQAPLLGK
jgi:hypothetical protein